VDQQSTLWQSGSWMKLNVTPTHPSTLRLKVVDQKCIHSLGQITQLPILMNKFSIETTSHVLGTSKAAGGFHVILGQPWLRKIRAINYWEKGHMKIGPHMNRINIKVISNESDNSHDINSSKDFDDTNLNSSWSSNWTSSSGDNSALEAEVYALDAISKIVIASPLVETKQFRKQENHDLLKLVKFGPTLTAQERNELEGLVLEYSELFVT
jgi:hypothetical protein